MAGGEGDEHWMFMSVILLSIGYFPSFSPVHLLLFARVAI